MNLSCRPTSVQRLSMLWPAAFACHKQAGRDLCQLPPILGHWSRGAENEVLKVLKDGHRSLKHQIVALRWMTQWLVWHVKPQRSI